MLKLFRVLFPKSRKEDTLTYNKFEKKLKILSKTIGIKVKNKYLYFEALTHRSYLYIGIDDTSILSNERLEFLGDSVLNLVVSQFIYFKYSTEDEGYLTKIRSQFVNRRTLSEVATRIKLNEFLLLSENANYALKQGATSIISDALESLIGAIFLDQGLPKAEEFINKFIITPYLKEIKILINKNYKSRLLEHIQANKLGSLIYKVVEESGPEHLREFKVEILINNESYGFGIGKTKKQAEQEAAYEALKKLQLIK